MAEFIPDGVFQKIVIFRNDKVLLLQAGKKYGHKSGT